MTERDAETVTGILRRAEAGERGAVDDLFRVVYGELHALARRQRVRWREDHTLNTTALVHEAYLKLIKGDHLGARSRAHFLAIAARAMRQILINYAKARRRLKRGGGMQRLSLDAVAEPPVRGPVLAPEDVERLIALEDALRRLESLSERQSRVVECRFFGGMSIPETAAALGTSPATVKRDWALAQAWLYREIEGATAG